MEYEIRNEQEKDYYEVENLVRNSFWNVYREGCTEHYVLHEFRKSENFIKELDFVMVKDGKIIGQIMYSKANLILPDNSLMPIATFGPICIKSEFKRQGYGKKLLDYSLEKAKEYGIKVLITEGNIDFYGKSGFVLGTSKGLRYLHADNSDKIIPYFIVKELYPDSLKGITGVYQDPKEYFVAEENPQAFEEYDKRFPNKLKEKNDNQIF